MSHNITSEKLITRTPCLLGAIALAIGLVLSGPAACGDEKVAKSELPKLTDMQLPTADELLRADDPNGKAFDWIVLNADGKVAHYHAGFYEVDAAQGLKDLEAVLADLLRGK